MDQAGNQDRATGKGGDAVNESDLCAVCGLCCNGALFARIELDPGEVVGLISVINFTQLEENLHISPLPCPKHCDNHCAIYAKRPRACARFRCHVLKSVADGSLDADTACIRIGEAIALFEELKEISVSLGEANRGQALNRTLSLFLKKFASGTEKGTLSSQEQAFARLACRYLMLIDHWFEKSDLVAGYIELVAVIQTWPGMVPSAKPTT